MAKHTVEHTCGHSVVHDLRGPGKDRERKLEWLEGRPCLECERAESNAAAAEANAASGLPALEGTEKQVAWAESLRAEKISDVEEYAAAIVKRHGSKPEFADRLAKLQGAVDLIKAEPAASFWIDNRFSAGIDLIRERI